MERCRLVPLFFISSCHLDRGMNGEIFLLVYTNVLMATHFFLLSELRFIACLLDRQGLMDFRILGFKLNLQLRLKLIHLRLQLRLINLKLRMKYKSPHSRHTLPQGATSS